MGYLGAFDSLKNSAAAGTAVADEYWFLFHVEGVVYQALLLGFGQDLERFFFRDPPAERIALEHVFLSGKPEADFQ